MGGERGVLLGIVQGEAGGEVHGNVANMQAAEERRDIGRGEFGRSPSLIPRCACEFANDGYGDGTVGGQWENPAIVLEQHHGFLCGTPCDGTVIHQIVGVIVLLHCRSSLFYEVEHPLCHAVKLVLIQQTVAYRHDHLFVCVRGRHLKIQSGFERLHAIVHGTPVADHHAVEPPFVA